MSGNFEESSVNTPPGLCAWKISHIITPELPGGALHLWFSLCPVFASAFLLPEVALPLLSLESHLESQHVGI